MYHYVEDKIFLKRAQTLCSTFVKELEELLRNEYDINSQIFLVGSGARNMVTQNSNETIDFDYNLNVLSCPDWNDGRYIKESVQKALNRIMRNHKLADVEDSTSSLTTKRIHFAGVPCIKFKMDVCIVTQDTDGLWERLIHQKTGFVCYDRYIWNQAPNSKGYQEKAKQIKSVPGWWDQKVRPLYLERKNLYLCRNDKNHPSFLCYIEVVHDVYNTMKQKHIL